MTTPVYLDEATFPAAVLASTTPVLVDFTASWCPPCKMIAPLLEELSTEYAGKLGFSAVDVDAEPDLAAQYDVQSMPTLVIFAGGREVKRIIGYTQKANLKLHIDHALGLIAV